jgi:ADP-L-glycero-D-manno-heptose 6-epimerase
MKILITGYKGFIGHNMVYALKDEHELFFFEWGDKFPDLEDIDICIHLGAISSTTETDIEKVLDQNYDFSRWLVNACDHWGVKFQYASSASVYGLSSNFSEGSPADPRSPYAWSKYLFDRYLNKMFMEQRFKIDIQGFRYFNVYGPHEDHKDQPSPHFKFEKQAKETGVIQLFENSDQYLRDFVPVKTVIDVHKAFFNINESGIWNLGTGVATSFESVARSIAEKYNARIEYIPMPENIALQYQKYTCADLTNLKQYYDPSNG